MRTIATTCVLVLLCSAVVSAEELDQFLKSVEEASAVSVPLRADGSFTVAAPEGSHTDDVALIVHPPADTYLELHQSGIKVLLLSASDTASRFKPGASKAEDLPPAASIADSDFTPEDLAPFRLARYQDRRISDDTATELTVTLYPRQSQYSLLVITFDRQKKVPIKTLYYRETVSNLVKMRRDSGHVLIGRKWVPTAITMETFKQRSHSTFALRWTQNPSFPPELFDPVFLPHPSNIVWPAPGSTPVP